MAAVKQASQRSVGAGLASALYTSHPHSLTHSLSLLFTHSLTHSLTLLLTHSLTFLFTHSLAHSLTHGMFQKRQECPAIGQSIFQGIMIIVDGWMLYFIHWLSFPCGSI